MLFLPLHYPPPPPPYKMGLHLWMKKIPHTASPHDSVVVYPLCLSFSSHKMTLIIVHLVVLRRDTLLWEVETSGRERRQVWKHTHSGIKSGTDVKACYNVNVLGDLWGVFTFIFQWNKVVRNLIERERERSREESRRRGALLIMHGDCWWLDCLRPAARRSGEREREGGERGRLTDARLGILPSIERETRLCPGPFRQAPDPCSDTLVCVCVCVWHRFTHWKLWNPQTSVVMGGEKKIHSVGIFDILEIAPVVPENELGSSAFWGWSNLNNVKVNSRPVIYLASSSLCQQIYIIIFPQDLGKSGQYLSSPWHI